MGYFERVKAKKYTDNKIKNISDLTPQQFKGANVINYFDPDAAADNTRLTRASGFPDAGVNAGTDNNFVASDFNKVSNGDTFSISKAGYQNTSMVFIYDENKKVLSDIRNSNSYTSPWTFTINQTGAAYMRVNIPTDSKPKEQQMIVPGSSYPAVYSPYMASSLDWLVLNDKSIGENNLADSLYNKVIKDIRKLYVPRKIYGLKGDTARVYYKSIVSAPNVSNFLYKSSFNEGISKIRKDHYARYSSTASSPADNIYLHDEKTGQLIDSKTFTIVYSDPLAKSNPSTPKNVLVFGDSFIQAGVIPDVLRDFLVNQNGLNNYKFIGQKTTESGTKHQGMGGYAIHDFVIPPQDMRPTFSNNPFFNPNTNKLDFQYYMSNNGFSGDIDYLVIHHGINDVLTYGRTGNQIVSDMKMFLDQLRVDYPGCKVLLCGLVPMSEYNDQYSAYLHNQKVFEVNKAYDDFSVEAGYSDYVTYVPVCAGFNPEYAYQVAFKPAYRGSTEQVKYLLDWLHPGEAGYNMEADQIKAAFISII